MPDSIFSFLIEQTFDTSFFNIVYFSLISLRAYPKQIQSSDRGALHVLMGKHHFIPIPPKNWPLKKKIGRREGCRVVVEWRGDTSDVWELLRE